MNPQSSEKSPGKEGDENLSASSRPKYQLGGDFEQLQNACIMMVDDEPITLNVMQTLLEYAGYRQFILVDDSVTAMDQLREHRPDVLLLDVVMPEVSGFDILALLRADPEFAHLPVIILTSSSDAATKLQSLDLGATDFISKPVDPSELALRVRNTLAAKAYQDQLSFYDVTTNLPNRHQFENRLNWAVVRAEQEDSKFAMLHISFDDFKRKADTFGPAVGDDLLRQMADRLMKQVRPAESSGTTTLENSAWIDVFHLFGADFSILVSSVDGAFGAAAIAQRILQSMRTPLNANQTDVYLTPSIGVAGFPDDATTASSLVKIAMGASSQATAQGGGRMLFYSSEINDVSLERLRLEADLRNALKNQEFRLHYQPKIDVVSGSITGAEALIRWYPKGRAIVSPDDFIPIADETGLIVPIGKWVLIEACNQIARWRDDGITIKVSVNVSARQLFETDFVSLVTTVLAEKKLSPSCLTIEITESFIIDGVEKAMGILQELRNVGLQISIDDFGTGYSSLSYLKNFTADELKLDRSFIVDVVNSRKDQALVSAVTYLSHELGFRVCAEGVEHNDQLRFLNKIKCDEYQGYYFSRPLTADNFKSLFCETRMLEKRAS